MKQNKIIVAINSDRVAREKILKRIIVDKGFALTASDASKLIKPTVNDIDLTKAYFVIADNYNFRDNPITRQRLYEMAARGIAVIVGVRMLQQEYEFICEAYYE